MKNKYLYLAFLSFSLISCNEDTEQIIKNDTPDFPNIDNTQAMGVKEALTAPTNTNIKLDSMKIYYYADFPYVAPNLPGIVYQNEVKESHPSPILNEVKHYFTYSESGYLDIRTIEIQKDDWYSNKFKFVLDYDYNEEHKLINVKTDVYVNNEHIFTQSTPYESELEQSYLNQIQTNQYNILSDFNSEFATPKNVFSPERNLFPPDIKLQYLVIFSLELQKIMYDYEGLYEILNGYFIQNMYLNTHVTFLQNYKNQNESIISLSNLQYKVNTDHYPEIIQYGNVYSGGYRYLYYYKKQ